MKISRTNFYLIIGLALLALAFPAWRTGALNNYLPFFMTTAGWNKHEREVNAKKPDELSIVAVTYHSDPGSLAVNFDNSRHTVTFTHPQTGALTLAQAMSGSGARYATADETVVFWEHQGEGSLTVNGVEFFRGTATQGKASTATSDEEK